MIRPRKRLGLVTLLAAPLLSIAMMGGTASAATEVTSAKTGPAVTQTTALAAGTSVGATTVTKSGCNFNVCLEITVLKPWVFAKVWTRLSFYSFDGHYQLINPRNNYWNSGPNRVWTHTDDWQPSKVGYIAGKWCVVGWKYGGGSAYKNVGKPCVSV